MTITYSPWSSIHSVDTTGSPAPSETDLSQIAFYDSFQLYDPDYELINTGRYKECRDTKITNVDGFPGDTQCVSTQAVPNRPTAPGNNYGYYGFIHNGADFTDRMDIVRNGEVWWRLAVKLSDTFDATCPDHLPHLMFGRGSPAVADTGYIRYLLDGKQGANAETLGYLSRVDNVLDRHNWGSEYDYVQRWDTPSTGAEPLLQRGRWHMLEVYAKLDWLPPHAGGKAEMRMWINGLPMGVMRAFPTISETDWWLKSTTFHSVWPKGAPTVQYDMCSHHTIAVRGYLRNGEIRDDTPHMSVDNSGFPYIGMATDATLGYSK